ncbi:unnamed protein product [Trifolium pratense]|uniref:Uncharacterized protein n=1 Tax=Trifolium pratense TaxID=57577 RepID=A0ACB0JC59_TRIPR|nr:unnamed protein product [Trifolium pratense]
MTVQSTCQGKFTIFSLNFCFISILNFQHILICVVFEQRKTRIGKKERKDENGSTYTNLCGYDAVAKICRTMSQLW